MSAAIPEETVPRKPDDVFDVVVIAASAGGLNAIIAVLSNLPVDLPACIVVLQHLTPSHPSRLASILERRTELKVKEAADGDRLVPGTVLIAPPDRHLVLNADGTVSLLDTDRVHFVRPSADVLFASAAANYGKRVVCIVLSGTGIDGANGSHAIKEAGGTLIVQDQQSAQYHGMPQAAIDAGAVDYVISDQDIASTLLKVLSQVKSSD